MESVKKHNYSKLINLIIGPLGFLLCYLLLPNALEPIIALVEKSISLPFILIAVIEVAIFINLGLAHFTGTRLSFIAPICISTIQLGATIDYAILMTTRYKSERLSGRDKKTAGKIALTTMFE